MNVRKVYGWKVDKVIIHPPLEIKECSISITSHFVKSDIEQRMKLKLKNTQYPSILGIQDYCVYSNDNPQSGNIVYAFLTGTSRNDKFTCNTYLKFEFIDIHPISTEYIPFDTLGDLMEYYKIPFGSNKYRNQKLDYHKQYFRSNEINLYVQYHENPDLVDMMGLEYVTLLSYNNISTISDAKSTSDHKLRNLLPIDLRSKLETNICVIQ